MLKGQGTFDGEGKPFFCTDLITRSITRQMNFKMILHTSFICSQRLNTLYFSKLTKIGNHNFDIRHILGNILKNIEWQAKNGILFEGLLFNLNSCPS